MDMNFFEVKFRSPMHLEELLSRAEKVRCKKHFLFLKHEISRKINRSMVSLLDGYCSQLSKYNSKFSSSLACWCVFLAEKKEFSTAISLIGFTSGKKMLVLASLDQKKSLELLKNNICYDALSIKPVALNSVNPNKLKEQFFRLVLFFTDNFL